MATQDYDKTKYKQIWPELLIPRKELLEKYAAVHHGGNQKDAITAIRARFMKQDQGLIEDMIAEIGAPYEQHLKDVEAEASKAKSTASVAAKVDSSGAGSGGSDVTTDEVTEEVVSE